MSTGIIGIVSRRAAAHTKILSRKTEVIVENILVHPVEQAIAQALRELRFGSIEIIVHDSKVVQIERREKMRLDAGVSHKTT